MLQALWVLYASKNDAIDFHIGAQPLMTDGLQWWPVNKQRGQEIKSPPPNTHTPPTPFPNRQHKEMWGGGEGGVGQIDHSNSQ